MPIFFKKNFFIVRDSFYDIVSTLEKIADFNNEAKMDKAAKAEKYFQEGYACSQSVLMAFAEELGLDIETAKKVSSTFGAGMGRLRKTCGALTGAFMGIGLKHGNTSPDDTKTKLDSYDMVRKLAKKFAEKHGTTECRELLIRYASKAAVESSDHHKIICNYLVKDAVRMLEDILAEKMNITIGIYCAKNDKKRHKYKGKSSESLLVKNDILE